MISIRQLIYLPGLEHWGKAVFVLPGVIYSGSPEYIGRALLAALSFCLVSSAVYIYNDLQNREEDRLHPQKCQRPLASGEVSPDFACAMLFLLLISGLIVAWSVSTTLSALLGICLLINLAYNHLSGDLPVFDVLSIVSGFMLRVLAGTIGIGLAISWWLVWTASLISLFIALCKRRMEKQSDSIIQTGTVLKRYSLFTLDMSIIWSAIACFLTYFLYLIVVREQSFYFLLTLPFAASGLGRLAWLATHDGRGGDPVSLFFSDTVSLLNALCFFLLTVVALIQ